MSRPKRGIWRTSHNRYKVLLPDTERTLLRSLVPQMRELLDASDPDPDPARGRLFPIAYPADEDRQTEYRLLVYDELYSSHLEALNALESSSAADELDEEGLNGWMRAINQVRLVLGSRLDISEEGNERPASPDDPLASMFGVYDYLTWLQDEIVDALSAT